MQLKPIERQVVAIVGASSGIGRETALQFADRGAKVVVSARNESGLNSLVAEIQAAGGEAKAILADVADYQQVKEIADYTVEQYGRIDTWVHCAATGILAPFTEITPEEFESVIDVTLMGQVYGAMAALPHLKREGTGDPYFFYGRKKSLTAPKSLFHSQTGFRRFSRISAHRTATSKNTRQRY